MKFYVAILKYMNRNDCDSMMF